MLHYSNSISYTSRLYIVLLLLLLPFMEYRISMRISVIYMLCIKCAKICRKYMTYTCRRHVYISPCDNILSAKLEFFNDAPEVLSYIYIVCISSSYIYPATRKVWGTIRLRIIGQVSVYFTNVSNAKWTEIEYLQKIAIFLCDK